MYGGSREYSPLHFSQGVARVPEYNFVSRCGAKTNGFQGASSGDRFLVGVRSVGSVSNLGNFICHVPSSPGMPAIAEWWRFVYVGGETAMAKGIGPGVCVCVCVCVYVYVYTSLPLQVLDEESMKVVRMIESNPVGFRSLFISHNGYFVQCKGILSQVNRHLLTIYYPVGFRDRPQVPVKIVASGIMN